MKYILVIDHIATGGAERILVDYYHHLVGKGHSVRVFVLSGHNGQSAWTEDLNIVYGSDTDRDNLLRKTVQQIGLYFKLQKLVTDEKPDVIFSFLEKSNLLVSLIKSDAIKVMTVHNVLSIQYLKVKSTAIRKVLYAIIRRMYNRCPNVVAVSKQVKDDLVSSFGVNEWNVKVINNYVDRCEIKRKATEKITNFNFLPNVKYVMNIGRFSDQKAQWKLIKAFSLYLKTCADNSKVHLVLVGRGEYEKNLRKLSDDLGISDNVTILPFDPNPYKYMVHAGLFVLSSIFEGFPIVLAEASSLRVPFVGSRKAIPKEMFDDKRVWKECIFDSTTFNANFTSEIHEDEKRLALLLGKGMEDAAFRNKILEQTSHWESNNDKLVQFKMYDELCKH